MTATATTVARIVAGQHVALADTTYVIVANVKTGPRHSAVTLRAVDGDTDVTRTLRRDVKLDVVPAPAPRKARAAAVSHADCDHAATKQGRAVCRRQRANAQFVADFLASRGDVTAVTIPALTADTITQADADAVADMIANA